MSYLLNNIDLTTYGILPGQISGSNISMSGVFNLPKRSGVCFHEWAESIQPYVDADEIFFEGRDLSFAGIILGTPDQVVIKLNIFYAAVNLFSDLVVFSTPYGSFSGYVKSITPEMTNSGCTFTLLFRETVYTLPSPLTLGDISVVTATSMEVGAIDNWTGLVKVRATDIRSKTFTDFTNIDKLTLNSLDSTAYSVYFYDTYGTFISGMEHSDGFDPAFMTGYLNGEGQLKATEILTSFGYLGTLTSDSGTPITSDSGQLITF